MENLPKKNGYFGPSFEFPDLGPRGVVLILRANGDVIRFFYGEHVMGFVTPLEDVRSTSDADTTLLNVIPEDLQKRLLVELMPMFMGDPFPKILMRVGNPEGIYFFMLREHEAVMQPVQVERIFQRRKLVP